MRAAVSVPRRKPRLQALIQRELNHHMHDAQQRRAQAAAAWQWGPEAGCAGWGQLAWLG